MKYIYALTVALGVIFFSSCSSNSSTNVTPVADSVSKGGNFQVTFTNDSSVTETFVTNDYVSNGQAVVVLYANIMYNSSDSLYHLNLQVIDEKMKRFGIIFNGSGPASTGTYTSTTNSSTLTDFTMAGGVTYAVSIGSTVNITQSSYPVKGTFNFQLAHNFFTTNATGSFTIFH